MRDLIFNIIFVNALQKDSFTAARGLDRQQRQDIIQIFGSLMVFGSVASFLI